MTNASRVLILASIGCFAANAGSSVDKSPAAIERFDPAELPKVGYSSQAVVIKTGSRLLHIAGQTAIALDYHIAGETLEAQTNEALKNLDFALRAGKARKRDLVNLRIFYVSQDSAGPKLIQKKLQEYFAGEPLPAVTMLGVPRLVADGMLIEIEGAAVVE